MQSAVNPVANAARSFSSLTYIGEDSSGGRLFKGEPGRHSHLQHVPWTVGMLPPRWGDLPLTATAAPRSPASPATGTSTVLSVLGADNLGEGNLAYTWSTTGSPPAAVSFSANGTNAAKNTTATFTKPGNYSFLVTIADQGGLSTTSSVNVAVNLTSTSISVQSGPLAADGTVTFTAVANDQFGNPMSPQPQFYLGRWPAAAHIRRAASSRPRTIPAVRRLRPPAARSAATRPSRFPAPLS